MAGLEKAMPSPGSIQPEFLEGPEEFVDEFVEGLFPPKPGGLIDRHRQREARRRAEVEAQEEEETPITGRAYKAVKVAVESPENYAGQSFTIAPGGSAQVLGNISQRFRATILVLPAASPNVSSALLGRDTGAVIGGVGFTLPNSLPLVVTGRGQLWAGNPNSFNITISVLSEYYSAEVTDVVS